jgi:deoxynucleoside triphosphate triphosphohydrolase SAMHD1
MSKIFKDPIHGRIELPEQIIKLIDTAEFQRLRNLKQLGFTSYVFYGATHTRFEHSIGVCHIAGSWVKHLQRSCKEITDRDVLVVQIAGLVHDIGHGPFSHSFERFIDMTRPGHKYRHEDMTTKIAKRIVPPEYIDDVVAIIEGSLSKRPHLASRAYLANIINNTVNGIDADKLDYFIRDSQCTSFSIASDWKRIVYESAVIDGEIVFPDKLREDIENLFRTRQRLYKEVYYHKTVLKVESLMLEAMVLQDLDTNKSISSSIDDISMFLLLSDSIVIDLERSSNPRIVELINRVKTRKLGQRSKKRWFRVEHDAVNVPKTTVYFSKKDTVGKIRFEEL